MDACQRAGASCRRRVSRLREARSMTDLAYAGLFFAGLLAGFEILVRFALRDPLGAVEPEPQIRLRQALILRMRILVAGVFLLTAALAVTVSITDGSLLRYAGLAALLVWAVTTFGGTVPINSAVLTWDPQAPPPDWRTLVTRWERLDTVRAGAALAAFVLFLLAVTP
ncbi:anthrone oxygenase family protein [Actinoplanes friuliensis]|uniref:anthrone oxygenase family protein n=1 Tax=Actinoplanes friuliensis TaxID=196914 RepID=UPI0011DD6482